MREPISKKIRVRIALILSAFALYHVYKHIVEIQTGCIQVNSHQQRCSFENAANFEGLLNLDLLFMCGWVAGAVVSWIGVVQANRKPRL